MFGNLDTEERAAVVAALLSVGDQAPQVLQFLTPPSAARCEAVARALLALERQQRASELARAAAALRAPVPAGSDAIHPDWRMAASAGEHRAVCSVLSGGEAADDGAGAWLLRRANADLVNMPPADAQGVAALARVDSPRLCAAITVWGRRSLARVVASASAAPAAVDVAPEPLSASRVAEVAARLGDRHGPAFVREVAAALDRTDERDAAHAAAALRGIVGDQHGAGGDALTRAGLRRLARLLVHAGGDVPRQVAQRLPRSLAADLLAHEREMVGESSASYDLGGEIKSLRACFPV